MLHLYNKLAGNNPKAAASAITTTTKASVASVSAKPPAGWTKYTGSGAELYLPPAFDLSLNSSKDIPMMVKKLQARGPSWAKLAQELESVDFSMVAIWVADSASMGSGFATNVNVMHDSTPVNMTLKQYLNAAASQLPQEWHLASQTDLSLNGREAVRMVFDYSLPNGTTASDLAYFVKMPSAVWEVVYTTRASEWQTRLPDFEKSAATFRPGS